MFKPAPVAIMVMLIVVTCMLPACTTKTSAPVGPPSIASFTIASENVSADESPIFYFEVDDCSSITITQDGEKVMEIEAAVPGSSATFLPSRHGVAYAIPEEQPGAKTHYSPGVYPIGFKGASNGKPSKIISKFGGTQREGSAEIEVRSWDGQVSKAKVAYTLVSASERTRDQWPDITAPDCASGDGSTNDKPEVGSFAINNPSMEEGVTPEFAFSVNNASMVKIRQDGEVVFYIQATSTSSPAAFHPQRHGAAYALPMNQTGTDAPYCQGVYPVIFKGTSTGRPPTIAWKFGDTENEGSAEIEACSPGGDVAIAMVDYIVLGSMEPKILNFRGPDNPVSPGSPIWYCMAIANGKTATIKGSDGATTAVVLPAIEEISGNEGDVAWCTATQKAANKRSFWITYGTSAGCSACNGVSFDSFDATGASCVREVEGESDTALMSVWGGPGGSGTSWGIVGFTYDSGTNRCYYNNVGRWDPECGRGDIPHDWPKGLVYVCQRSSAPEIEGPGSVTLIVTGLDGTVVEDTVDITVADVGLPVINCSLSSLDIPEGGGQVLVYWDSEKADKVMMAVGDAAPNQVPSEGSLNVTVTQSTCFKFTAYNVNGSSDTKCCVGVHWLPPQFPEPPIPPEPPTPPVIPGDRT
ncbi:MAG TPA: hypothetical protein VF366_05740 [Dehalococcoidia bacterium]